MPAESKKQQRFMGMVHAVQKGDMKAPSEDISEAAKSMKKKDVTDFASTKTKGLPEKKDMSKESRGTIPALLHSVGEGKPLQSAVLQSLLFGGAGYLGGKAVGGLRNWWSGEDDKDRTNRIARNWGLMGAGAGILANIPGLRRNRELGKFEGKPWSRLNTTRDQIDDPKFMAEYYKGLGAPQKSLLDSMTARRKAIDQQLTGVSDEDRQLLYEMAQDNARRRSLTSHGVWNPGELTALDYPHVSQDRANRMLPHLGAIDEYVRAYGALPGGAKSYVNTLNKSSAYISEGTGIMDAARDYGTFLPPTRPGFGFPAHYTRQQIENDPYLSPTGKAQALQFIDNASGGKAGLITGADITRAAVGAGIGYAGATLVGKVLDGVFGGLAPSTHKKLIQAGTVAGLLLNTGVISR